LSATSPRVVEVFRRRRTDDDKLDTDEDDVENEEENPSAGTMAIVAMTRRCMKRTIVESGRLNL
jgi:hypothetical protein